MNTSEKQKKVLDIIIPKNLLEQIKLFEARIGKIGPEIAADKVDKARIVALLAALVTYNQLDLIINEVYCAAATTVLLQGKEKKPDTIKRILLAFSPSFDEHLPMLEKAVCHDYKTLPGDAIEMAINDAMKLYIILSDERDSEAPVHFTTASGSGFGTTIDCLMRS